MVERHKLEVGQAIRARRKALGMSQKDLALATHYKEAQTVSRWERGENMPSNPDAVAAALKWTLAEMVAGVTPPNNRVARQLGLRPVEKEPATEPRQTPDLSLVRADPSVAQLDRIEAKVDQILKAMGLTAPEEPPEGLAGSGRPPGPPPKKPGEPPIEETPPEPETGAEAGDSDIG